MKDVMNELMSQIAQLKEEKESQEGAEQLVTIGKIIGLQEAVLKLLEVEYECI